ncbi:hypothetical protein ACFV0T_00535 [Streptomyces sp. NPDC059582]|uniref:Rv1733c family protein n=1 Tax=Streptomyces sp. NPDC059582 TaxID=3346875 RepID=UPI0036AB9098
MAFRGPKVWLWRWRRNPLRRRTDAVEAWVVLGAWAVTVLAGVLAGLTATWSVEDGLAREREEWRPAVAHLTEKAPGTARVQTGTASGDRVWGKADWTAADGTAHSGLVRVRPGSTAGTPVMIWTDRQGSMVTRPATPAEAQVRSSLVGGLAGVSTAAVPFIAGRALRARLERRRMDRWDADWARFDPLWGRQTG